MKFFKPEDFFVEGVKQSYHQRIADFANAKLEREGKVIECNIAEDKSLFLHSFLGPTHKALLINIEPIETCKHPINKVHIDFPDSFYKCACGAKVRPKEFEEINAKD